MADSRSLFQLNGCNADAVLARAKALMVSSRTEAARKDAKTDYSFALLQASIDEAIKALKARNESAVGTMARHEVMAHIPSVRDFMQERITSKALRELLDSLTDEEIASLYVARLTSIEIIYITTPEELRDFCKRYPDLDARKIQAFGTYLVISLWDDEHKVERMSWYVGAAPRQTLAQRQKAYTSQFKRMERGEAAPGQRNLFHEGTHDHVHLPLTTTMGPTGVTDWPRLLCKAFTGKSFDQFDDDVLAYLLITLDEAIGAAVLNTVFGGYPGLSKLYGYRFSERQIQPGNTHPPLLPDHLSPEAQQMEREAKRHCALAPSARANEQVPQPVTAPAPLPQAPTASVSKTPEPRWVRFVVPKDNESDDEDFCLVSTAGTDADKNAQTIEIAAVLSGPDRKLAAKQFASSELPGCPAKVVNGRIIVTVGKHSFALPQQSMRSLNSSGDGYFPDKTDVIIQIRSMSGIVVPSAPSTACWMLAKYAIFVKGAGHRSRYQPVGGIVDDAWARFLHLLAEVMTLRGVSRGTRMQLTGGGIGSV